jgi:ornithine decarboxylase
MASDRFDDVPAMIRALTPSYPVYCIHPDVLRATAKRFVESFPGRVLYAIKCNPHPKVLQILYDAGIRHFDTASLPEIAQVREQFRDAGAYFMHPVKARAAIKAAYEVYGIRHFVVDHPTEMTKVLDETGGEGVTVIVRIATPAAGAAYDLSKKFGVRPNDAAEILKEAKSWGCQTGLAFHVGSQCLVPRAYKTALEIVGDILEAAKVDLHMLDVGGGFPAAYQGVQMPPLESYMDEINGGLKQLDLRRDCVVMCEPGRAMVADGMSLVTQVLLRKEDQVYINDGIYGSLSEMVTARVQMPVRAIRLKGGMSGTSMDFTIAGPTCDSLDVLPFTFHLPDDIDEGDWIEIGMVGAYGNALRTNFNGFYPDTFIEVARTADAMMSPATARVIAS